MPPLPQALLRLLEAVEDDDVSIATLAELISRDPVLAARVLTAANSVAFRRTSEIVRISDCVKIIGTRIVRTMATCLAVQHAFDPLSRELRANLSGFWHHSLLVAESARAVAVLAPGVKPEEAYLAGLLHDLGELMLLVGVPEYAGLLAICPDEATLPGLEQQTLGADHAAVGAWMADQWNLDSLLADAVLFHHRSATEIAVADALSRLLWVAHTWIASGELPATAEALVGVPAADLLAALTQAAERVETIAAALGFAQPEDEPRSKRPFPILTTAAVVPPASAADAGVDAAVRDMAMMQPLQRSLFALETDTEILFALRESVSILFGINRLAFLNFDPATNTFSGAADGTHPTLLRQLVIPLDSANSLVALAARRGEPCTSFEQEGNAPPSLVDTQLLRGLSSERLLCVPMRTSKRLVGVIAFGLSQTQFARMGKRIAWLTNFAHLAASTLEAWREARDYQSQIQADIAGRYERHARRIMHEAGNPLGIITNYLALLDRKLPDDSPLHEELAIVGEEIDRVTRLIGQMGEPTGESADTDLNALVREMVSFYDGALFAPRGIAVELALADSPPRFSGNRDSVKQILLNLFKNAANAMDKGGRLSVSTTLDVYEGGQHYVELDIADNGPGLPLEVHRRLRGDAPEPAGGRHGIGLSVVTALIAGLGGRMICKTRAGEGTSFSILIPAARMAQMEATR